MSPAEIIGITLLVSAVLLFLLEVKVPGFGAFGVAAVVAMVAGLYLALGASVALPLFALVGLPVVALFAALAVLAHRARSNKVLTGDAGMIGLEGRAETALAPQGKVLVRGELWHACSPVPLEPGVPVRVVGVQGLRLEVAPVTPDRRPALAAVISDRIDRTLDADS